ncbi:MAG TPA: hypothetical protein VF395_03935, partial [Polyangiaceae bacterium]
AGCGATRAAEPPEHPALTLPAPATHGATGAVSIAAAPTGPGAAAPPRPGRSAPAQGGEIPRLGAAWGTSVPLTLVAAAPDRRWLVLCEADRDTTGDGRIDVVVGPQGTLSGDALNGFYIDAETRGERIDSFVGSDPTGRFVALVREGHLVLRDSTTRMDTDLSSLGADVRDDTASFLNPRAGSFAPRGALFLYLRRETDHTRVVIRDLGTGEETVINPPPGELYRADFDASGEWVVIRMITQDTNGNGRLEWPVPEARGPFMRCTGPLPRYSVWERAHDEPSMFVARVAGGSVVEAAGLVTPLGGSFIVREADETLARVKDNGVRTPVVRKGCAARLLHADAARGLALFTCLGKKGRSDALLVGADFTKPLGLELAATTGDHIQPFAPRLVALHPGADAVLVDLDEKSVERLSSGDRIVATAGTRALVLRGRALLVHELGGRDRPPFGEPAALARLLRTGNVVVVPPFVVDVGTSELLGTTTSRPLAVSADGAILVPDGQDADATHLATGPLRWKRADLPAAVRT